MAETIGIMTSHDHKMDGIEISRPIVALRPWVCHILRMGTEWDRHYRYAITIQKMKSFWNSTINQPKWPIKIRLVTSAQPKHLCHRETPSEIETNIEHWNNSSASSVSILDGIVLLDLCVKKIGVYNPLHISTINPTARVVVNQLTNDESDQLAVNPCFCRLNWWCSIMFHAHIQYDFQHYLTCSGEITMFKS